MLLCAVQHFINTRGHVFGGHHLDAYSILQSSQIHHTSFHNSFIAHVQVSYCSLIVILISNYMISTDENNDNYDTTAGYDTVS